MRTEGKEDIKESSFAELYENTLKNVKEGEIVKGKIIAIQKREVIIDIGYKSEGILPLEELNDPSSIKVGDEIEVLFESLDDENGMVVLSKRKAERQKCWDDLLTNANEGSIVPI